VALAVGVLVSACSGLGGPGVLFLAPALLLLATLHARRYPGERLLLGLAARARRQRLRPSRTRSAPAARPLHVPRGGLLMGFALAVRPPPRLPAAS
jgi:hypothetical protein